MLAAALAANLSALCAAPAALAQQAAPVVACGGATMARGTVPRVIDARTFALDDGREVRLAAIEVPSPASAQDAPAARADGDAVAALDALVGGDAVLLRQAGTATDRYGRLVAYASAVRDGEEIFTQGELVASGFARVGDNVGSRTCAADLLAREAAARKAGLGLWGNGYYDVLDASQRADVLARRGRFVLVEGKVESVHESGSTLYVNFGRHWSVDFAVTVAKRNERVFTASGVDLKDLAGRRVLVRGWVETRGAAGAPVIEAAHPEQIVAADAQ